LATKAKICACRRSAAKLLSKDETRRIAATEGLLGYEALSGAVEAAKVFLASVFEDREQHVDDRLDALKLMRKAEARKITQPTVRSAEADRNRELSREMEIACRREKLWKAGLWPPAPDWADNLLRKDYKAPRGKSFRDLLED
jgi:hypothetical protein